MEIYIIINGIRASVRQDDEKNLSGNCSSFCCWSRGEDTAIKLRNIHYRESACKSNRQGIAEAGIGMIFLIKTGFYKIFNIKLVESAEAYFRRNANTFLGHFGYKKVIFKGHFSIFEKKAIR